MTPLPSGRRQVTDATGIDAAGIVHRLAVLAAESHGRRQPFECKGRTTSDCPHRSSTSSTREHSRANARNTTSTCSTGWRSRLSPSTAGCHAAGELRSRLEAAGRPIGSSDLLIAGQAKARGLVLITANTREFERVEACVPKIGRPPADALDRRDSGQPDGLSSSPSPANGLDVESSGLFGSGAP